MMMLSKSFHQIAPPVLTVARELLLQGVRYPFLALRQRCAALWWRDQWSGAVNTPPPSVSSLVCTAEMPPLDEVQLMAFSVAKLMLTPLMLTLRSLLLHIVDANAVDVDVADNADIALVSRSARPVVSR